jgi:3-methylcrotonyl-CoA carboxylase alpha subunit
VTEEITGQDLVEWQLRVASGEPLPKQQDELSIDGWAIEARLYAENPATGFLPSTGRLDHLQLARQSLAFSEDEPLASARGVRVETGITAGAEVSPFYDPMIAKLICRRDTREQALDALADVCAHVQVWPVRTNAAFLARLLREPAFVMGEATTGFIGEHVDRLVEPVGVSPGLASFALGVLMERSGAPASGEWPIGNRLAGFRLNASPRTNAVIRFDGRAIPAQLPETAPWSFADTADSFIIFGEGAVVFAFGEPHVATLASRPSTNGTAADGAILSPMPGRIIAVEVSSGDAVAKGQKLVTLEAMKMEHTLTAPFDGVVAELSAEEGAQVSEGALLARVGKREK